MSDETGRERAAVEGRPVAVFRYAGRSEHGTRPGTMTPHADDAGRKAALRARGWRVMNHRPLGELQRGDKMDADAVADLVDDSVRTGGSEARTLVLDFLEHADPTDLHYWGSIDSDDLAVLREDDPVEYFRRLACTVAVARKAGGGAGGVHVLDHTGGAHASRTEVAAWRAMFEAYGLATLPEPLYGGRGVCLERWFFDRLCDGKEPGEPAFGLGELIYRWWGPPRDRTEPWPWGGVRAHWLRQVRSRGHTPCVNHEGLDAGLGADAALDAWAEGIDPIDETEEGVA